MGGTEPPSETAKDPEVYKRPLEASGIQQPPGSGFEELERSSWVEVEHGIGRYRTVQIREYGETIFVIEPIWEWPLPERSPERAKSLPRPVDTIEVVDVAYNRLSDEVVALISAWDHGERTENARLEVYQGGGSPPQYSWDLPDDESTSFSLNPYVDLATGPDGRIYVLDDYQDRALVFDADCSSLGAIDVAPDTRRIAGGPEGTLFALREPGYVERYAADGSVTARFDGRPFSTAHPSTLTAIAADERGYVYVADGLSSIVSVFAPGGDKPDRQPIPSGPTCELAVDKTADPTLVVLGDTTEVALTIDGRCGVGEEPADVMLVVLYYPQLAHRLSIPGQEDPAMWIVRELRRLVSRIDFRKHRVGVVAYWGSAELVQALTHDRASVLRAISKVPRKWPSCNRQPIYYGTDSGFYCQLVPRVREGIEFAQDEFEPGGSARNVMVLYQPDYCNNEMEHYAWYCRGYVDAEEAAEEAKAAGTQIVVFDGNRTDYRRFRFNGSPYLNDAQTLATSDDDVAFDFETAQQRMVEYRVPASLAADVELQDELPSNMRLVPGSLEPAGSSTAGKAVWQLPSLGYGLSRFRLLVEPLEVGRWPTNSRAVAVLTDGWGIDHHLTFPVPQVEVVAPTATPTSEPPTATATATATATRPPVPGVVYLPVAYNAECFPSFVPVNAVLVVDASSSMEEQTTGGRPKLAAAKEGAKSFVALMRQRDRTAVVEFNETARLLAGLTNDKSALNAAIDGIATASWTRLDRALDTAAEELTSDRRQPESRPVIVLLTDGRQSQTGDQVVRDTAQRVRASGAVIFTIGVGSGVDAALLAEVAGDPARYYGADDAEALPDIYRRISESIPCP